MKCPKCQAELAEGGELDCDGVHYLVFACDTCVVPINFGGELFDSALSFAVDDSGRIFHPETLEPLSLN